MARVEELTAVVEELIAVLQLQAQELPIIKHLPVAVVAPTVQAVGFVAGGDDIARNEGAAHALQPVTGRRAVVEVRGAGRRAVVLEVTGGRRMDVTGPVGRRWPNVDGAA